MLTPHHRLPTDRAKQASRETAAAYTRARRRRLDELEERDRRRREKELATPRRRAREEMAERFRAETSEEATRARAAAAEARRLEAAQVFNDWKAVVDDLERRAHDVADVRRCLWERDLDGAIEADQRRQSAGRLVGELKEMLMQRGIWRSR